ncbi:Alpha/Beta hydrolase protein [Mycena rebaudengoi]|nr:Alpha/Beta hydrolase protein [Mycena rebaudengoi]
MTIQVLDIPYLTNAGPLQMFDVYAPRKPQGKRIICFVHGGAWGAEDKSMHSGLASALADAVQCPVLVPNYRLTPRPPAENNELRHPVHAQDILQFLDYVVNIWEGIPDVLDPKGQAIYLIGHSCGAHMLASAFLDSSTVTPTLTPSAAVLQAVKGIAMSEGIYDIDLLLSRFPDYEGWFIASAFGKRESYAEFSTTRLPLREDSNIRWLVIHSSGDTLVDVAQSTTMHQHLVTLGVDVVGNMDQIAVDHDDVLLAPEFISIIHTFLDGH